MLNNSIQEQVLKLLNLKDYTTAISGIRPLSGGSINAVYRFEVNKQSYVLKVNDSGKYPEMFEKEAQGLKLLSKHSSFSIPKTIGTGATEGKSFLLMEHIDSAIPKTGFWKDFANKLVSLHRHTSQNNCFGLDHSNYIGSLPQQNNWTQNWHRFYTEQRLIPLFEKGEKHGQFNGVDKENIIHLSDNLHNYIPDEKPALLHGDLWSGNFMVAENGDPCLIDPAVYYGHRETELAFMQMFGGFGAELFQEYASQFPLESGFENRVDLHQLYPLLVHSILFGGHYVQEVKSILAKWGKK